MIDLVLLHALSVCVQSLANNSSLLASSLRLSAMDRESDSELEMMALNSCGSAGPASAVRKQVKKTEQRGQRKFEVAFPSFEKMEQLTSEMDLSPFQWADKFWDGFQRAGLKPESHGRTEVTFYSEFSGSGAAEAALEAVTPAGVKVKTAYAADLDAGCRSVLMASSYSVAIQPLVIGIGVAM